MRQKELATRGPSDLGKKRWLRCDGYGPHGRRGGNRMSAMFRRVLKFGSVSRIAIPKGASLTIFQISPSESEQHRVPGCRSV